MAEGVSSPICKLPLHKVRMFAVVDTNLLTLVVRNTVTTTPFRILMPRYIKEVELSIESKI